MCVSLSGAIGQLELSAFQTIITNKLSFFLVFLGTSLDKINWFQTRSYSSQSCMGKSVLSHFLYVFVIVFLYASQKFYYNTECLCWHAGVADGLQCMCQALPAFTVHVFLKENNLSLLCLHLFDIFQFSPCRLLSHSLVLYLRVILFVIVRTLCKSVDSHRPFYVWSKEVLIFLILRPD